MMKEFQVHILNEQGKTAARQIAEVFNAALMSLVAICPAGTREFALVRTKMEEACFFDKKAMASDPSNGTVQED